MLDPGELVMMNSIKTLLIEKLDRMYTLREAAMPFSGDPLPVELLQMPCSTQGQIRIFPYNSYRKNHTTASTALHMK